MIFQVIIFIYCATSKLIASNTLVTPKMIDIYDLNSNLTVWFEFRNQTLKKYQQNNKKKQVKTHIFSIFDQNQVNGAGATFFRQEEQIIMSFFLTNQTKQQLGYQIGDPDVWKKIKLFRDRDTCFNKLEFEEINLMKNCSAIRDAKLYLFNTNYMHIYIYDSDELENEELVLSNFMLQTQSFRIITNRNYLSLKFYTKFFTNSEEDYIMFSLDEFLIFSTTSNSINIKKHFELLYYLNFEKDSWFLFSVEFDLKQIVIYYYINETINQLKILLSKPQYSTTRFGIYNTKAIIFNNIQIISYITHKFHISCNSTCQFCLFGECQDNKKNKTLEFNINKQIKDFAQINQNYFYPNQCGERFFLSDDYCYELPTYKGQHCKDCNITKKILSSKFMNISLIQNYQIFLQHDNITAQIDKNNGLIFEEDLYIFLMKSKDLFLIYQTDQLKYCESGYQFFGKCMKNKNNQRSDFNGMSKFCKQNFYQINQKTCMKCQNHCLYCKLERKTLKCILCVDDYFLNDKNIVKKCTRDSQILNCLSQDLAIESIKSKLKGKEYCQYNQIYQLNCVNITDYSSKYDYFINLADHMQIQSQKLEIQYLIDDENLQNNQIKFHIVIQNLIKISEFIKYFSTKQISVLNNFIFEQLSNNNQTLEDILIRKITLHDITIILFDKPEIYYNNELFSSLQEIYEQLQVQIEYQFKIIQFDITFDIVSLIKFQNYSFFIDKNKHRNQELIFNITFKQINNIIAGGNKFSFKCNVIILNNIVLNQHEIKMNFNGPSFTIDADFIIIENLEIQDQIIEGLFYIKDFYELHLQQIWILDSKIQRFLTTNRDSSQNSSIQIKDVYVFHSSLNSFIEVSAAYVYISNFYYRCVEIETYLLNIMHHNLKVTYFYLYQVSLQFSNLIQHAGYSQQFDSISSIQSMYVEEAQADSSILIYIQNIRYLKIVDFYISIHIFNSTLIKVEYNLVIQIEGIILKQILSSNSSVFFQFQSDEIIFSELFICLVESEYTTNIIDLRSNKIQLNQLMVKSSYFTFSQIAFLTADIIKMNKIFVHYIKLNHTFSAFEIASHGLLDIRNVHFNYLNINDSILIYINSSKGGIQLKDFQLNNIQIFIIQSNTIKNYKMRVIIFVRVEHDHVTLQQFSIKNVLFDANQQQDTYCLIGIQGEQNLIIMSQFLIFNIYSQFQQSLLIGTKNFYILDIRDFKIQKSSFMAFIQFISGKLIIQNCNFLNIFQNQDTYFIYLEKNFQESQVWLLNMRLIMFSGYFFRSDAIKKSEYYLNKISVKNQLQQQFSLVFSRYFFEGSKYYMNQIRMNYYNNKNQYSDQLNNSFISGYFDTLIINNLFTKNSCQTLLSVFMYQRVIISNIDIAQQISSLNVLFLEGSKNSSKLTIENLTIRNSLIIESSLIDLNQLQGVVIIQNFIVIDTTSEFPVLWMTTSNTKPTVFLNNIILKNVINKDCAFLSQISLNFQRTTIIGGKYQCIFGDRIDNITYTSGLIAGIEEPCTLANNLQVILDQSEVVNSNIHTIYDQLIKKNSQFLGNYDSHHLKIQMYFSLNRGRECLKYIQISDNLYQVQFSQNNTYLYLPSGRDMKDYKYFNIVTGKYERLYESISLVNFNEIEETNCSSKLTLNDQVIIEYDFVVSPGLNEFRNLIFTLNPLIKNQYIEFDVICNQSKQLITYRLLIKTFNCQLGEYLFSDQCLSCNIEQLLYSVGYNQQYCLLMDQNIIETIDIGQLKLFKQYWRYSYANKYIEQCKNDNCLGGWKPGDHSCKVGYVGALCQECDVYNIGGHGYFGRTSSQCSQCYFGYQIYLKGLLLLIIQMGLVYITFYQNKQLSAQHLLQKISKRNFIEILLRLNVNQVPIMLKLYYNYLFTLYLLKDFNNFGTIVDLSLNIISNPSFIAVPQFDCLITQIVQYPIQYTQLLLKIIVPIAIINIVVITYVILIKLKQAKYEIQVIIVILVVTYQQNQQVILQSLIKLISKVKYSNIYWTLENLNVQYFSKNHRFYLLRLVIPLIILFVIVNTIIYFWIRRVNQRTLNNLKYSIFILRQYNNQFYFWDYAKQIYIWLFMIVFYTYDVNLIMLLNIIFNIIIYLCQPFQLKNFNKIDQLIHLLSHITYFGILTYQNINTINKILIITLSNIILLIIYLKYLMHSLDIYYRQQRINILNLLVKLCPYFGKHLSTQIYTKNNYYYAILKQGIKKSNYALINELGKKAESKQIQINQFEIEMPLMNIKQ